MRSALALGLRLAWHGNRAARLRSVLVAFATLVGASVLLSAAGLTAADVIANPSRYSDRGMIWLAAALVMGVGVPVLVLAATVGRLSAGMRGRRLVNLRLLGLSPHQTRLVAVAETGVAAVVGSLAAWIVSFALRPLLTLVPVWGTTYPAGAIAPPILVTATIVVAVPLVVVTVASLPERLGRAQVLAGVRRAEARRPSSWRLLPLAVGIAWCAWFSFLVRTTTIENTTWVAVNLIGSVTVLGIAVLLVVPVAVRLVGDVLHALGRSPAVLLAARRIQAQPATMTRVVAGLLIGLFVVTGARCVVVAFESTPQYQAAERNVDIQQVATVGIETDDLAEATRGLRNLRGVRAAIPTYVRESGDCMTGPDCFTGQVLSCGDLARLAPAARGCRDDEPMWLGAPRKVPDVLIWKAPDGGTVRLPSPTREIAGLTDADYGSLDAEILLPPDLTGVRRLTNGDSQVMVLADPGRDLPELLSGSGFAGSVGYYSADDYDYVATLRALVWSIGSLVISLGLLSFGIAAIDRAVERRREVTALQLVGVPASVLRRAQWIEVAAPLVIGSLLAVGAGLAAGATYLSLDESRQLPWQATMLLAALGCVGGVAIAGLTVIAANPRLHPDLIRAE